MIHTVTIEPDGRSFVARADETLLQAARRAGLVLPHECGWGNCGTCKVTLVSGQTELMFHGAPAVIPRDARTGRILSCQSMARSDLTIRLSPSAPSPLPLPSVEQDAELLSVEELAPDIRRFTLRPAVSADFLPGQYAILHLGPGLRRAYSMANLPDGQVLQVISKRYAGGAGSNALARLLPGDRMVIESPFGACTLKARPGRKVFVAGGTGISPILSLVAQAARDGLDFGAPVDVIYCARTPADLAAGEELAATVRRVPAARYRPFVEAGGTGVHGIGRAPEALMTLDCDPAETEFYVAGPPVMVAAVKAQLKEAGVPITRINYDSFG